MATVARPDRVCRLDAGMWRDRRSRNLRVARDGEVRFHRHPPGAIERRPMCFARVAPSPGAFAPAVQRIVWACTLSVASPSTHRHRAVVDIGHLGVGPHRHAQTSQGERRLGGQVGGKSWQDAPPPSSKKMVTCGGSIAPKSPLSVVCANSPRLPGQFHTGGAAADDDERHPGPAFGRIYLALPRLQTPENTPPDLEGVLDGLQPGRLRRPFVIAEILMACADRDHQRVVRPAAVASETVRRATLISTTSASGARDVAIAREHRRNRWAISP